MVFCVAVNKPAGLFVHQNIILAKDEEDAVVQRLRDRTGKWFLFTGLTRTSGVLIMACLSRGSKIALIQFAESKTQETYSYVS